jgi:hypothetical protein
MVSEISEAELGKNNMNQSQFSGARYKVQQQRLERPGGVTLIACFQILKAGVLLLTATLLQWKPEVVDSSRSVLYPLLYVATRGRYAALNAAMNGANLLPGLIFLFGLYLAVIGSGLWQLKKWARRTVMFTCGMTLLLWAKSTFLPSTLSSGLSSASPDLQNFHILLFFDAVVFVYLIRGDTAEVFEARA